MYVLYTNRSLSCLFCCVKVGTAEERLTSVMEQAETMDDPAVIKAQQRLNEG